MGDIAHVGRPQPLMAGCPRIAMLQRKPSDRSYQTDDVIEREHGWSIIATTGRLGFTNALTVSGLWRAIAPHHARQYAIGIARPLNPQKPDIRRLA
jgi:hypothetical protein